MQQTYSQSKPSFIPSQEPINKGFHVVSSSNKKNQRFNSKALANQSKTAKKRCIRDFINTIRDLDPFGLVLYRAYLFLVSLTGNKFGSTLASDTTVAATTNMFGYRTRKRRFGASLSNILSCWKAVSRTWTNITKNHSLKEKGLIYVYDRGYKTAKEKRHEKKSTAVTPNSFVRIPAVIDALIEMLPELSFFDPRNQLTVSKNPFTYVKDYKDEESISTPPSGEEIRNSIKRLINDIKHKLFTSFSMEDSVCRLRKIQESCLNTPPKKKVALKKKGSTPLDTGRGREYTLLGTLIFNTEEA